MDIEKAKIRLAETFTLVQNLQLQPTKHNVDILSTIMRNLDEAFGELEKGNGTNKSTVPEGEQDNA